MWRSDSRLRPLLATAMLIGLLPSSGCMLHAIREKRTPPDYGPLSLPTRSHPEEGSIWPGRAPSGSFLFFDQKARGIGDLVTVVIDEVVSAEGSASTDLGRSSSISSGLSSDVGFAGLISKAVRTFLGAVGVTDPGRDVAKGSNINLVQGDTGNDFTGDGTTKREGRFRATVTCRVVNVLPGGVFHVRGRRSLLVNNEEQFLTVEGLIRKEDISIDNTVASASLAEARLGLDGFGVIGEKQHPGWLARVLDWILPL